MLPIAGDGPFGLFGPNLFGDAESRALPYPINGSASGDGSELDPDWVKHDPARDLDADEHRQPVRRPGRRLPGGHARQGMGLGFGGGTAEYAAPAVIDPPNEGPYYPVAPVETGNAGVTPGILERSDVAIADHECPIMPTANWAPNLGATLFFSVPEDVVPFVEGHARSRCRLPRREPHERPRRRRASSRPSTSSTSTRSREPGWA